MKQTIKQLIVRMLWAQVRRLRKKYKPDVVVVAGSVGKTGTKRAIAQMLSQEKHVQWQDGNYNDIISIPLIFFGQTMPRLWNPFGWLWIFINSQYQIMRSYKHEVVVVEAGIDHIGDMDAIGEYLQADYGVLTAIAPEHMENFKSLDAVAKEELKIAGMVDQLFYDINAVPKKYHSKLKGALTYGSTSSDCQYKVGKLTKRLQRPVVFKMRGQEIKISTGVIGTQGVPAIAVAVLIAAKMEFPRSAITAGAASIQPFAGRMRPLAGVQGSLIIDDTYNASPTAVRAALDTLYEIPVRQKIAILGQMNELGGFSQRAHVAIGRYCDPKQLSLVVTIGEDANKYLAGAAEKKGCKVMRCPSPYHAADVAGITIKKAGVILAKGSQNGVFAEEAVKELLANPADSVKLVRQSKSWLRIKQQQFK